MKRFYLRLRVMLMMLALGLASVNFFNWVNNFRSEVYVELPQVESGSVIEVITRKNNGRFEVTGSACGGTNKYGRTSSTIGYQTNDWQNAAENNSGYSNAKEAKKEIEAQIKDAVKVLYDTTYFNKQSKLQERRVILENEYRGERWIDILQYDGDKFIKTISAKSLELALELEQAIKIEE